MVDITVEKFVSMHTDLVVNYQAHRSVCEEEEKREDLIKGPWQCSDSWLHTPLLRHKVSILSQPLSIAEGG